LATISKIVTHLLELLIQLLLLLSAYLERVALLLKVVEC